MTCVENTEDTLCFWERTLVFVLIQFVLLPGQVEVRVGSLATVTLPAGRGGVKRRECGAGGGGGGGGS